MHATPGAVGPRSRPPVLVVSSSILPTRILTLARHVVPVVLPYAALTGLVLARLRPPAVAMALFCPTHDAARMAGRLGRLGYRGRVLLLVPPLPDRDMVERELRSQFPGLRLHVTVVPDLTTG